MCENVFCENSDEFFLREVIAYLKNISTFAPQSREIANEKIRNRVR